MPFSPPRLCTYILGIVSAACCTPLSLSLIHVVKLLLPPWCIGMPRATSVLRKTRNDSFCRDVSRQQAMQCRNRKRSGPLFPFPLLCFSLRDSLSVLGPFFSSAPTEMQVCTVRQKSTVAKLWAKAFQQFRGPRPLNCIPCLSEGSEGGGWAQTFS